MDKELMKKFREIANGDDEQAKIELAKSEEFKLIMNEITNMVNEIKKSFEAAVDYYKPIFKAVIHAHKAYEERNKHIMKISYKAKKTQSKNWRKWKKRR